MQRMNCDEAKKIDMVDYLASAGFQPKRIKGNDYWYLSPFRDEKEPSFKVNRKFNVWYDHGLGKGGNLIDFGVLYFQIPVAELLEKLGQNNFSFHRQNLNILKLNAGEKEKITVINVRQEITSLSLIKYLQKRRIPLSIANLYCREVDFKLYDKKHTAIGFRNNANGYELRSDYFKGSSSPKTITLMVSDPSKKLLVFEGFFNFLSHQTINQKRILLPKLHSNFLVLNSLSFFEKSREIMEKHSNIHLYLDRDTAGMNVTQKALANSNQYIDESYKYKNHKDINEYLVKEFPKIESLRTGRSL